MFHATTIGITFESACRYGTFGRAHSIFEKAMNIQISDEGQLLTILCEGADIMSAGCIVNAPSDVGERISVGDKVLMTPDVVYIEQIPFACYISSANIWDRLSAADISAIAKPSYRNLFETCKEVESYLNIFGKSEMTLRPLLHDELNPLDFIGLGYGLTPAGDDFLAGMLFGMYFLEDMYGKSCSYLSEMIDIISKNLHRTGTISKHFLRYALKGEWGRNTENFLIALAKGEKDELWDAVCAKMAYGASSGEDELRGCLFGIKKYINDVGGDSFVYNS